MPRAKSNGLELEYETFGDPADPALVLVMGLGAQLVDWPQEFCATLAARRLHVIRFDNRDAGLSTSLDELGMPDLGALVARSGASAPYVLSDLADDVVGLLDALDIAEAHLVGASMGGMIAQQVAIDHADRVLSLCSIMSTTGDPSVGQATAEALAMLGRPPAATREEAIRGAVLAGKILGSPDSPLSDAERVARATAKYDRSYRPLGSIRQVAAIVASPDRTPALHDVTVPTVVIHGAADPLIDVSGGRATAAAVPDAELVVIPGMGHDLPEAAWPRITDAIVENASKNAGRGVGAS
jgi:pimeloyl-ACP methyl ester carboxylesterase